MLVGCLAVLMTASSPFLTDVPEPIRAKLQATNETRGAFVQMKRLSDGTSFTSRGRYRIRPGIDFEWCTTEPFEALFRTTKAEYCYSNEDECVTKPLSELRGFSNFSDAEKGDFSAFFKAFDSLYKEEDGVFHVLSKPKDARLGRFLSRVEADGVLTNWTLRVTFPDRTVMELRLTDDGRKSP